MKIKKSAVKDDSLLLDPIFDKYPFLSEERQKLADAGITTYSKLIEVIDDDDADLDIRRLACWSVSHVRDSVDKRRVASPLLKALHSSDDDVRIAAAHSLGLLKIKRATPALIEIARNKQQSVTVRQMIVNSIGFVNDRRISESLTAIIFDESDDLCVRAEAIEWRDHTGQKFPINEYIQLLAHAEADIRFWAAYRLTQPWARVSSTIMRQALSQLDLVAAYDHRVPKFGLWHVDREAFCALEGIYWKLLNPRSQYGGHVPQYLISPAPEYTTFQWRYLEYQDDRSYKVSPSPHVELKVDPDWLATKLHEQWPDMILNVREPRPQTYLLDWQMKIGRQTLIGGLHRDQCAVVVTGDEKAVVRFAAWYRSIFPAEQYLFLYEWAYLAVPLKPGDKPEDVYQSI